MATSQSGVPGDRATPHVGLVPRLELVPAPIHLRLTMVLTVWDLEAKLRIVPQTHVQVMVIFFL